MAEIGEKSFGPRKTENNATQNDHAGATVMRQKLGPHCRVQGLEDAWVLCDSSRPQRCNRNKPERHDRTEKLSDGLRPPVLEKEKANKNPQRHRNDKVLRFGSRNLKPFHRRKDRNSWSNHPVPIKKR